MNEFDPEMEVKKLQEQTSTIRKTRFSQSRLDRYKGELLTLSRSGATCAELQRYLRTKRIKVVHSTVARWLVKNG